MPLAVTIVCLLLLVLLLLEAALTCYFFRKIIMRRTASGSGPDMDTGTEWDRYKGMIRERYDWLAAQKPEEVFLTSPDGLKLHGLFLPAEKPTKNTILAVHGYMSQGVNDFSAFSPFYHGLGYNMLIVDDRAHGQSEGKYIGFGCLDKYDCLLWINYLEKRLGADCAVFLHGISMGGSTVLMASGLELPPCVKGIIADCAFTCAWDVFAYQLKKVYHMPAFPLLNLTSFVCKKLAGYDFRECPTTLQVAKSNLPILFIHGAQDTFVPTRMVHAHFDACKAGKRLLIVEGAGHAASYYADTEAYEKAVKDFLRLCSFPATVAGNGKDRC